MTDGKKTVAVLGASGNIGSLVAARLGRAQEIGTLQLIGRNTTKLDAFRSEIESAAHIGKASTVFYHGEIRPASFEVAGSLAECSTAPDVVVMAASIPFDIKSYKGKTDNLRDKILVDNAQLMFEFIQPQYTELYEKTGKLPVTITVTNPLDSIGTLLAEHYEQLTGDPAEKQKVIGSGGSLDTDRAVQNLARKLKLKRHDDIEHMAAMGEHGTHMVVPEYSATVKGKPLRDYLKEVMGEEQAEQFIQQWKQETLIHGTKISKEMGKITQYAPAEECVFLTRLITNPEANPFMENTGNLVVHAYDPALGVMIGQMGRVNEAGAFPEEQQPRLTEREQEQFAAAVERIRYNTELMKKAHDVQTMLADMGYTINSNDHGSFDLKLISEKPLESRSNSAKLRLLVEDAGGTVTPQDNALPALQVNTLDDNFVNAVTDLHTALQQPKQSIGR